MSVTSPSAAVLDYYAVEGDRSRDERGYVLRPKSSASLDRLPLIATEKGQRTLVVADRRVPLYEAGGTARHVVLQVERRERRWLPV